MNHVLHLTSLTCNSDIHSCFSSRTQSAETDATTSKGVGEDGISRALSKLARLFSIETTLNDHETR